MRLIKSYDKFLFLAKLNEIDGLPSNNGFLDKPEAELTQRLKKWHKDF
jgi:hypothetical protein